MADPEQSISQAQITAAQAQSKQGEGLERHHKWSVANLDERIFVFIGVLVFLVLFVVWLSAPSALVVYGSVGVLILLTIAWGVFRILRINKIQEERERQVRAVQSGPRSHTEAAAAKQHDNG